MSPRTAVYVRFGTHPALERIDPTTAFLYAPHTVSALLLGLTIIAYSAGLLQTPPAADLAASAAAQQQLHGSEGAAAGSHSIAGLWAACAVFLGYSVVQGPRTSMVRPHPAVWRLVHGAAVLYVMGLVLMLHQTVHTARQALKVFDPRLGVEVQYRDYGTSCALLHPSSKTLDWSVLGPTLLDEFVVAHSLGWWAKALLIRNTGLLWTYSVAFELLELTFAHMLPNFNECWWDSWVLDVAICNSLGIYSGMATVRWLDMRYTNYNWQGWSELQGLRQRARRSVGQLLPYSWSKLNWMMSRSPMRCLQALLVVAACLAVEVNVFFLKYALWVPPTNPLNTARLVLWLLVAAPAIREYYEFIEGSSGSQEVAGGYRFYKLGTFAWLACAMMALETMISIKFGRGLYTAPWPRHILFCWAVAGTTFACVLLVWQYRLYRSSSSDRSKNGVAGSGSTAKGTAASCSTAGETGSGRQASINGSVRGRRGGAAHKHL